MTHTDRFEAIEIKLAHLERSLQELGQTVMRQQRDIENISAQNHAMRRQLESLDADAANVDRMEKPPHY
jgi:uncharacterized coiled-coil protein SlyX